VDLTVVFILLFACEHFTVFILFPDIKIIKLSKVECTNNMRVVFKVDHVLNKLTYELDKSIQIVAYLPAIFPNNLIEEVSFISQVQEGMREVSHAENLWVQEWVLKA
jgi:hypothetical protein